MLNPPAFQFPLETVAIPIGDRLWQIRSLRSRDIFLATQSTAQRDLYGFVLWESAIGLSEQLVAQPALVRDKAILELGAGVGLPGIVAQSLGGHVSQTDYHHDSLTLCQWNGGQNGVHTTIFQGDWTQWQHTPRYDLIIAADILYEEALHFYIERILHRNLRANGQLLFADPGRPQALDFMLYLEAHGWQVSIDTARVIPQRSGDPNPLTPSQDGAVAVTLYGARKAR